MLSVRSRRKWAAYGILFGLALCIALPTSELRASQIGVAAAVNPDAFSSLGDAPKTQLNIGKSIFFNERINTTGSGLVQVLLVDGSTFTVGPGSDLVINKFVYDPNKKSGEVVASFSKGVMRFVGGKISKNPDGVTVNTPSGALAIRGGMFMGKIWAGNSIFAFLYGEELKLTTPKGKELVVFEPGNGIYIIGGAAEVKKVSTADIGVLLAGLTKGKTGGTGNEKVFVGWKPGHIVALLSLQDLITDATETQIQDQIQSESKTADTNPPPSDTPPEGDTQQPSTVDNNPPPIDPPTIPPATGGEPGGFAAGLQLRTEEELTFPAVLEGVSFASSPTTIAFSYDSEAGDVASITFDDAGQATSVSVLQGGEPVTVRASSANLTTSETLLCADCTFLKSGNWNAAINAKPIKIQVDDGWWVAGEVTSVANLNALGALNATATYNGSVRGTVASLNEGNWKTFNTSGDLIMHWSFADRNGDLAINNFDSRSYGTGAHGLSQPSMNINQFGGALTQSGGPSIGDMTGRASGSFVNNGSIAAGGVMGNWNVNAAAYRATGIFGGSGVPH